MRFIVIDTKLGDIVYHSKETDHHGGFLSWERDFKEAIKIYKRHKPNAIMYLALELKDTDPMMVGEEQ